MNTRPVALSLVAVAAFLCGPAATAKDERVTFPIAEAMTTESAKEQLNTEITMVFGDAAAPAVERSFGTFTSNKKTNGVGKSDKVACEWAFLSAIKSFQERAVREGGDAVINIRSFYKSKPFTSTTEYECGTGNIMVGVALQGEVVKLKK